LVIGLNLKNSSLNRHFKRWQKRAAALNEPQLLLHQMDVEHY